MFLAVKHHARHRTWDRRKIVRQDMGVKDWCLLPSSVVGRSPFEASDVGPNGTLGVAVRKGMR